MSLSKNVSFSKFEALISERLLFKPLRSTLDAFCKFRRLVALYFLTIAAARSGSFLLTKFAPFSTLLLKIRTKKFTIEAARPTKGRIDGVQSVSRTDDYDFASLI
uniref:Uncharacterized protein n=1 Tax=Romanomermis culicivorax TaxID=13658 RepID=A0A915JBM6_ROMCU